MNRTTIIGIVLGAIGLGLLVLLFAMRGRDTDKKYYWGEDYNPISDQPYGTSVMTELLDDYFPNHDLTIVSTDINAALQDTKPEHRTYLYIGDYPYYTDSTFALIKDFVSRGNDAFLALNSIPENLSNDILLKGQLSTYSYDTIYYTDSYGDSTYTLQENYADDPSVISEFQYSKVAMNFFNNDFRVGDGFQFTFLIESKPANYSWNYFYPEYLKRMPAYKKIGSIYSRNFTNYIQVPYGDGFFYIHVNPIVFTNLFQIEENKLDYTSKLFSYLKPGDILWDIATPPQYKPEEQEGPLKYILSQRSLRWAWYVLLVGLGIFLIFKSKRVQQPITVLEPNENKSLDFIQTIGRMYFLKRNNHQLVQQKMKLFLN
ncbi:MAG: DUF4350 domain-containing protein, partial [Chitinophagales bacterium]